MTDLQVCLLAVGVWLGALLPVGASRLVLVACGLCVLIAWRRRMPWILIVAASLLASLAAGSAWASIAPATTRSFDGQVVLASDPVPVTGGVRVAATIEGDRYDLRAWGSSAGWLRNRLMGEQISIEANLRPLGDAPEWLLAQGLSGRGTVTSVGGFDVGSPHTRLANSIRRTIESGAASLARDEQALFAGLVYGDDRQQSPLTADNFQAAGLTHLLAVSGQNVAFALAIVGPLLRRLGHRQRFAFVLAVLLVFATVTRFEPSVVRASVMTAVASVAALVGTEVSSRRILSVAIAVLVIVDPLIVHRVAFQLSVAASAGILFWSGRVARAVPGPRWFAESLAVTASAQLAVAPLLVWKFDGLPVASLPANLLAGPAAGPVMMWGLTAGLVAGLVPVWAAAWMHVPTAWALWWIDSVAAYVPALPMGVLGGSHIVLLFVIGGVGLRQIQQPMRAAAAVALAVVLLHPAVVLATTPRATLGIDDESTIWQDESATVVVLGPRTRPELVLASMRQANVGDIDIVVARRSTYATASLVGWMQTRHQIDHVWAPEPTMGVGEDVPDHEVLIPIDGRVLSVRSEAGELVIARALGD